MTQRHYIYLKYAISELQHDAIMIQAKRCGAESVRQFLNMIISFEIERFSEEYTKTLSEEELERYNRIKTATERAAEMYQGESDPALDEELPF